MPAPRWWQWAIPRLLLALACCGIGLAQATTMYKCQIDGAWSFQESPCPSSQTRQRPTAESLNAERNLI